MNKDGVRIEKIKSEHAELLRMVRASIEENKDHLSESIDSVITVLDFDDKTIKRYEATVQAQELIVSLTKEILEAKTKEEVINIRKKLNYYINKIKAEIKRRNLDEAYLNDYQEKASYLRKDIAKYIRFLKREENIQEIDRLYSNYEQLSEEEMITLKKALRREVNYNRRNLATPVEEKAQEVVVESNDESSEKVVEDSAETVVPNGEESEQHEFVEESQEHDFDEDFQSEDGEKSAEDPFGLEFPVDEEESDHDRLDLSSLFEETENPETVVIDDESRLRLSESLRVTPPRFNYFMKDLNQTDFSEVRGYFEKKIDQFNSQYNIAPTLDYSRRYKGRNIIHFFRNIPRYIHNKKMIKHMIADFCMFYHGNDLGSYIEYLKQRNSIRGGLRCLFSKTHLYDNSDLIKHNKCSKWLYEFCRQNNLDITFQTEKSM